MSRCYLDTDFLYVHLRTPNEGAPAEVKRWRTKIFEATASGVSVISALVIDELAYRLLLAWLRDEGERDPLPTYRNDPESVMRTMKKRLTRLWGSLDALELELVPTDQLVVDRAKAYMAKPGLAPRDAFHTAHAIQANCTMLASSDPGFDRVQGLRRIGPDD